MKSSNIVLTLIAASGIALTTVALAQPFGGPGYGMGYGMGMRGAGPAGAGNAACAQLFTPEERLALHDRVHAATTFEERQQLIDQHRAQLQERASAAGIECNTYGPGAGYGYGYGHGMMGRGGMWGGGGPGFFGGGAGLGGACGVQLFTVEERTALRDQMRAATTPEQRQALLEQHRADARARAAQRGVQCPGL